MNFLNKIYNSFIIFDIRKKIKKTVSYFSFF